MYTRVGKKYGQDGPARRAYKMPFEKQKKRKQKTKGLRMYTRTGPYVVTYMMLIIMLIYVNDLI